MNDALGDRMKRYESVSEHYLTRRTPVIVRVDGKAFHTLTRYFNKPFDANFNEVMRATAHKLCEKIQGCKLAYTQSDEISLLLTDWEKLDTEPWFGYNLNKVVSISAALASVYFNANRAVLQSQIVLGIIKECHLLTEVFDSRAFNIPKEEVCNYFIWRQQDATRNSVNMVASHYFSPKQLHGLNSDQRQEKLWQEKQINWNNLDTRYKRGSCIKKDSTGKWQDDLEIPIFTQDRAYIEDLLKNEEAT